MVAVPVERSTVEVLAGSEIIMFAIVQPVCLISVTVYLPGDNSLLVQISPLPKLKGPSAAEDTKVNSAVALVGQAALTTEIKPPTGGVWASW